MSLQSSETASNYEIEIAPLLMQVAAICKKHGISFAAFAELDGAVRETSFLAEGYSFAMHSGILAFRAGGSIDAYVGSVADLAKKTGHKSPLLTHLGIPAVPVPAQPTLTPPTPEGASDV